MCPLTLLWYFFSIHIHISNHYTVHLHSVICLLYLKKLEVKKYRKYSHAVPTLNDYKPMNLIRFFIFIMVNTNDIFKDQKTAILCKYGSQYIILSNWICLMW